MIKTKRRPAFPYRIMALDHALSFDCNDTKELRDKVAKNVSQANRKYAPKIFVWEQCNDGLRIIRKR